MYTKKDLIELASFLHNDGFRTFSDHFRSCQYDEEKLKVCLSTWQGDSVGRWICQFIFCPFKDIPTKRYNDHYLSKAIITWRLTRGI